MTYTLYYSPGASSMAVHVILNEVAADFKLENTSIMEGKNRTPEFLKLNPRGQVPVLVEDGQPLREAGAIITHLVEKHNSPLIPKSGTERTVAIEWLFYCDATLHPAYSRAFFLMRSAEDADAKAKLLDIACKNISKLWEEIEDRLAQHEYIAGDKITVADILLTVIANWSAYFPAIVIGDRARNLFKKVSGRPAYQKALAAEGVEYKVAA
jgi:glutathione S-transferase